MLAQMGALQAAAGALARETRVQSALSLLSSSLFLPARGSSTSFLLFIFDRATREKEYAKERKRFFFPFSNTI